MAGFGADGSFFFILGCPIFTTHKLARPYHLCVCPDVMEATLLPFSTTPTANLSMLNSIVIVRRTSSCLCCRSSPIVRLLACLLAAAPPYLPARLPAPPRLALRDSVADLTVAWIADEMGPLCTFRAKAGTLSDIPRTVYTSPKNRLVRG